MFLKPIVLGLGLVAGIAFGAQAQTVSGAPTPGTSIATLPADSGPRTNSHNTIPGPAPQAVAPSPNKQLGVHPGAGWYPTEKQTQAVTPSPKYPGPRPN
jgi:hypothetical protein